MTFHISSSIAYKVNDSATVICSLQCMQTTGQTVRSEELVTSNGVTYQELSMGLGGNRFARILIDKPGPFQVDYEAQVETSYALVSRGDIPPRDASTMTPDVLPYLFPSRYCQSDLLRQEAAELFPPADCLYSQVETIVDWISENVDYVSGSTDEQTSAVDVLEKKVGVCRDFAHLAIALCRALSIPARYATVYAHELQPQDFHACFEAFIGDAWYLFDATNLAPLNGLVRISTGRDASDTAVASLYGDILGKGVSVSCICTDDDFVPITRGDLQERQQAFILL